MPAFSGIWISWSTDIYHKHLIITAYYWAITSVSVWKKKSKTIMLFIHRALLCAIYYTAFTAVNMSQHSPMKTVIISLSAAPPETLTILHPPSLGKHASFTQTILRQCENRCKSVGNRAITPYCAWSVTSGWMRFITFSMRNKKKKKKLCTMWSLKHNSISQATDCLAETRIGRTTHLQTVLH